MLANPTARERGANARMGDEDAAEALQRGVSKAALARRFGVSRRTIHEWVETGQLDRDLSSGGGRYSPRPAVPHKLAPYTGIVEARLEEFPGLSAKRLFDEVRAAGYPGGYSRVRDYVRAVRPREPVEAVVRFETPAGRQGQVDFATFTLPWGRRHALVVSLYLDSASCPWRLALLGFLALSPVFLHPEADGPLGGVRHHSSLRTCRLCGCGRWALIKLRKGFSQVGSLSIECSQPSLRADARIRPEDLLGEHTASSQRRSLSAFVAPARGTRPRWPGW